MRDPFFQNWRTLGRPNISTFTLVCHKIKISRGVLTKKAVHIGIRNHGFIKYYGNRNI